MVEGPSSLATRHLLTPLELRAFQANHFDHLARPLRVDGDAGLLTRWALAAASVSPQRRMMRRRAQLYLGVKEVPPRSNDDPDGHIRRWLLAAGAKPGDPWCAAYVCHCLEVLSGRPIRCAGACRLGRLFPPTDDPWLMDVFWYPTTGDRGHIGFVAGKDEREIMTWEGNCDNEMRCARRPRGGLRFGRTVPDVTGWCPGVIPSVALAGGATR